jgi:CO/xanthine dehydrogenase Mo-binding subunit
MGGAIWGLSSALFEQTEVDQGTARFVNDNLADYLIPVNADVPSVEIIMVPEQEERVNPLGIKGVGEIGIVGTNAAVANAVFHFLSLFLIRKGNGFQLFDVRKVLGTRAGALARGNPCTATA